MHIHVPQVNTYSKLKKRVLDRIVHTTLSCLYSRLGINVIRTQDVCVSYIVAVLHVPRGDFFFEIDCMFAGYFDPTYNIVLNRIEYRSGYRIDNWA